jgi:hypothetical protein
MPVAFICDGGCGKYGQKEEFEELGVARKKMYCTICSPSVKDFMEKRDVLHTEAAKHFHDGLEDLKTTWKVSHPGTLPDE